MRTIKFRGKDSHSGEWFYGNLFVEDARGRTHISTLERGCFRIDIDTIGQFTGLYDKNGKEIYEGDIILYGGSIQHEVVFRHGAFGYLLYGGEFVSYAGNTNFTFNPLNRSKEHEVIGNIYDNPELRQTQYDDTTTIH